MRTYSAVTTCHRNGYELYGREMARSFDEYWPKEVMLHFYTEGFTGDVKSERIIYHDLLAESQGLTDFKTRHRDNPAAHGKRAKPSWRVRINLKKLEFKIRRKPPLPFLWDAVRFSHKTFAIFDAARKCGSDVLFWIDADSRTKERVPIEFLEGLVPPDCLVGYLWRLNYYSECGFVAYNLRHPAIAEFLGAFEELYTKDLLFREKQWHDSYLFDVIRKRFEAKGVKTFDIGVGLGKTVGHIFDESQLGKYMTHAKGERKYILVDSNSSQD